MRSIVAAFAVFVALALAAPAAAHADPAPRLRPAPASPLWGGEHARAVREEVRLHEQRAHELEPIIARDRQARRDVEADWIVLERHARELHGRANDFRSYASESMSPRAQQDLTNFANELDNFAGHDEENARMQHEVADRLDRAVQSEEAVRDWHLKMAQRLRDWLAQNAP
jgi:hypothetical protein